MNYSWGDIIIIDGIKYIVNSRFSICYEIRLLNKYGLADKATCKIVVESIYDSFYEYYEHYLVELDGKYGLINKKTYKFLLNPEYNTSNTDELLEIYVSKMRVEKLRQLEEIL